jgi:hypothetical protein
MQSSGSYTRAKRRHADYENGILIKIYLDNKIIRCALYLS